MALALCLTVVAVLFVGVGLERTLPAGSGIVTAMLVYPYFFIGIGWEHVLQLDLWASIFVMLAFGLLLCGLISTGIAATLVAAMSRILSWQWAVAVLIAMIAMGLARKRWSYAAWAGGGFAAVIAMFALHWHTVSTEYPGILTQADRAVGVGASFFQAGAIAGALPRIGAVSSFLVFPQTFGAFTGAWYALPALAFFAMTAWRSTRRSAARYANLAACCISSASSHSSGCRRTPATTGRSILSRSRWWAPRLCS